MTTSLERVLAKTLEAVERAAPVPPGDLVGLVKEGLRRRRRRRVLAVGVAAVVAVVTVAAVAILPSAAPQKRVAIEPTMSPAPNPTSVVTGTCSVRELPIPSSFPEEPLIVAANDVDPTGRYVVGYVEGRVGVAVMAVLWVDGKPQFLKGDTDAVAVNASGVVVGWNLAGGWVYRGGRTTRLPVSPGSGGTTPTAINSRGDIIGESGGKAVVWPGDQRGQPRSVGEGGSMSGISDDGLMIEVAGNNEARLWDPDGTVHALPAEFAYRPRMIAGSWVLGEASAIGANPVGVRYALWNLKTGAIVRLAMDTAGTGFKATALSESGVVVGYVVGADHLIRPAIFRAGKVILLRLPDGHSDDVETTAISADGRTIVGNDRSQALLWHC